VSRAAAELLARFANGAYALLLLARAQRRTDTLIERVSYLDFNSPDSGRRDDGSV